MMSRYDGVNMLFGKYFAFHDIDFERLIGVSEETLALMEAQNKRTGKAYRTDARKRGVVPVSDF